jgi:diketogulonate reductase-like aldo/keto reductase
MHITIPQLGLGTFRLKDGQAIDAVDRGERLVSPDFAPNWD